jgi:hypothetical protein
MACACGCTQPRFGSPCACGSSCGCGSPCVCGIRRVRMRRLLLLPIAPMGELRGVIYRASRLPGETPRNYVHFFGPQFPVLATDPGGRQLYIIGGRYRVTKRGIEG